MCSKRKHSGTRDMDNECIPTPSKKTTTSDEWHTGLTDNICTGFDNADGAHDVLAPQGNPSWEVSPNTDKIEWSSKTSDSGGDTRDDKSAHTERRSNAVQDAKPQRQTVKEARRSKKGDGYGGKRQDLTSNADCINNAKPTACSNPWNDASTKEERKTYKKSVDSPKTQRVKIRNRQQSNRESAGGKSQVENWSSCCPGDMEGEADDSCVSTPVEEECGIHSHSTEGTIDEKEPSPGSQNESQGLDTWEDWKHQCKNPENASTSQSKVEISADHCNDESERCDTVNQEWKRLCDIETDAIGGDYLDLPLPREFVNQLIGLFGPIEDTVRDVKIPLLIEDAKLLHHCLKSGERVAVEVKRRVRDIWIVGSSIVHWAHQRTRFSYGRSFGFQKRGVNILWNGKRGMRWKELIPFLDGTKKKFPHSNPSAVIIYLGGNDILSTSRSTLIRNMVADLKIVKQLYPNAEIMWCNIFPRDFKDKDTVDNMNPEKTRQTINDQVSISLEAIGGHVIKFPAITLDKQEYYREDGIHLTDAGNDELLLTLASNIELFCEDYGWFNDK